MYPLHAGAFKNIVTCKWKAYNGKIQNSQPALIVNFEVFVKVLSTPSCVCGILYFKLNGMDVIYSH